MKSLHLRVSGLHTRKRKSVCSQAVATATTIVYSLFFCSVLRVATHSSEFASGAESGSRAFQQLKASRPFVVSGRPRSSETSANGAIG